jgi:hypothetical protein
MTPATVADSTCPHCGGAPTVPRGDGLVPICQTCMLGRSTEEAGGKTAAATVGARSDSSLATRMYAAIPLWVLHLQELDDARFWATWRRWVAEANELPVSEAMLYPDANRAEAEQHFTAYAKAIAALTFCHGGVPMFGRRWESRRPPSPGGERAVPTMQTPAARVRAPSTRQRRQNR